MIKCNNKLCNNEAEILFKKRWLCMACYNSDNPNPASSDLKADIQDRIKLNQIQNEIINLKNKQKVIRI